MGEREKREKRPYVVKPERDAGNDAWRNYIKQRGKYATAGEWQEMLEVLGKDAAQEEWDQYLNICGLSENAGDEESTGNKRYEFGMDEALSEDWMNAEDDAATHQREGDHNPFCPLRVGIGLNAQIDQPGDRPIEDLFDED